MQSFPSSLDQMLFWQDWVYRWMFLPLFPHECGSCWCSAFFWSRLHSVLRTSLSRVRSFLKSEQWVTSRFQWFWGVGSSEEKRTVFEWLLLIKAWFETLYLLMDVTCAVFTKYTWTLSPPGAFISRFKANKWASSTFGVSCWCFWSFLSLFPAGGVDLRSENSWWAHHHHHHPHSGVSFVKL